MVRLRSRTNCPVGGFQFVDAAISDQPVQTWDFRSMVQQIQSRRQANPRFNLPTDIGTIENEVDEQNAMRMLSIQGADSYIFVDGPSPPINFHRPRNPSSRGAVGGVRQVASGAGVLYDWLGAGGIPVSGEASEQRAGTCAVCPLNHQGDWLSWFTQPAQELIKRQLSIRKDLDLTTSKDDKLEVCEACACPLKLKVHVPLQHVLDHLSADTKKKLDKGCWILAEEAKRG